jgi:hypothetical protein
MPYLIVWDLDNTVGEFDALQGAEGNADGVRVRVRPGLAEALALLTREGFTHTLLTLASPRYAELALRGTGLRDHFARVEGYGQRGKGDTEGLGRAFGIPEGERPRRMIFVGDHPLFDAPEDPRVVLHLEPFAMTRPAADLARLLLHLRASGNGSLRDGFYTLGRTARWWQRLLRRPPMRVGEPVRREVTGLGALLLLDPGDVCPRLGFADPPEPPGTPSEHLVVVDGFESA